MNGRAHVREGAAGRREVDLLVGCEQEGGLGGCVHMPLYSLASSYSQLRV